MFWVPFLGKANLGGKSEISKKKSLLLRRFQPSETKQTKTDKADETLANPVMGWVLGNKDGGSKGGRGVVGEVVAVVTAEVVVVVVKVVEETP